MHRELLEDQYHVELRILFSGVVLLAVNTPFVF